MSWEFFKYEATCKKCGHTGICISGSDDWGGSSTDWIGFDSRAPSHTAIIRKKSGADDYTPICKCGSSEIQVGKSLGPCDRSGK